MKNSIIKPNMFLAGIFLAGILTACNGNQQQDGALDNDPVDAVAEPLPTPPPGEVEEALGEERSWETVMLGYMDVKNALVEDNFQEAKNEASHMLVRFNEVAEEELAAEQYQQLREKISGMANAGDVESLRETFYSLSQQLYQLEKQQDLSQETLYWQHCPMAMDDQGANWLSYEEQVQNPYMGQQMPKCGSVEETLE